MSSNSSIECPLCHTPSPEIPSGKIVLRECPACQFVFKDPRHHCDPETEKRRYGLHSTVASGEYTRNMEAFVQTAILPFKREGTVLDYGCGRIGLLARILTREGLAVSGYDPYFQTDPAPLSETYDVVAAVEVVEHFQDPKSEFARLTALVKKGGILAIATQFVLPDLTRWWYVRDITHYSFYSDRSFEEIARQNGLTLRWTNHRNTIVFEKR